jgi:hypothetical protein
VLPVGYGYAEAFAPSGERRNEIQAMSANIEETVLKPIQPHPRFNGCFGYVACFGCSLIRRYRLHFVSSP